jgi:hypothetical protein
VKILYENIDPSKVDNFDKFDDQTITLLGEPYDYGSIMHYRVDSFAKAPFLHTLEPVHTPKPGVKLGQREALSELDIRKVNKHYGCDQSKTVGDEKTTTTAATPSTDKGRIVGIKL